MDVRNCKSCGKLYNYYGGQQFCQTCLSKLEDTFKLVKEYIYDHPQAGVQEIAEEFEVSVPIIYRWVREDRLSFAEDSPIGIPCEGCGVTIKSGRYCKKCRNELTNKLSNVYKKKTEYQEHVKEDANAKMRFFK